MRKIIKTIVILLIVFISINTLFPNNVYAIGDPLGSIFSFIIDGLLGFAIYPIKIVILLPAVLIYNFGAFNSLENIFFNEVAITKINVFDTTDATGSILAIRESVAGFYIAFRNLAIILSLAVLIYIGIQMAISNIAEQRAKYKQMLTNWIVGFGLVFILHYIIIITINANEMLVETLKNSLDTINMDEILGKLLLQAWLPSLTTSFTAIVIYITFLVMSLIFLIIYIKRMITISFLILIAPLISITYSIDKIDNNRSEILNTWLKEFMYNVFIQPFHCLIYLIFIGTAMDILNGTILVDFGSMVFAIIFIFSIFLGQKIVREIFGFEQATSLTKKVAILAAIKTAWGTAQTVMAIKGAKNDKAAKARFRKLPIGQNANPQDYVKAREQAEQNRMEEEKAAKTTSAGGASTTPTTPQPKPTTSGTTGTKPKETIWKRARRRFIHAPSPVKRTVRFYGDAIKQLTGYNWGKNLINQRKQKRVNHMTEEDYFIGASQMYRNGQTMSNEELAKKMEELYDETDINKLKPEELNFKAFIEHMKQNYTKDDMVDLIINGTKDNKRWRAKVK